MWASCAMTCASSAEVDCEDGDVFMIVPPCASKIFRLLELLHFTSSISWCRFPRGIRHCNHPLIFIDHLHRTVTLTGVGSVMVTDSTSRSITSGNKTYHDWV